MAKYLVIVESPAKVKTIKKFLGSNYEVMASNGHVRDLPKSQLGVDVENDYEPKYITIRGKGDVLAKLRKEVKKAEKVYLATDPDREGEAISWHLANVLKLDDKKVNRISFNEITKNAVKASLKEARDIDINLVDAQQTRRILDRMVGYRISPVLWAKVKRGLSAGRVQSVALKLICDREEEINAFIAKEYWTLDANVKTDKSKKAFVAKFYGDSSGRIDINSKEEIDKIRQSIEGKDFIVSEVKSGERVKNAPLPFITSTLQQEASKQVLASLRDIKETSTQVQQTSQQMFGSMSELQNAAQHLDSIASVVANSMTEMDNGIKEITQTSQTIADQTVRARDSLQQLEAMLDKFKLEL